MSTAYRNRRKAIRRGEALSGKRDGARTMWTHDEVRENARLARQIQIVVNAQTFLKQPQAGGKLTAENLRYG